MKLLLFAVVALCEAARITRGIDRISHFSNNQAVYHGHGATSYQNVRIDNHDDIVVPTNYGDLAEIQDLEHRESIIPVVDSHYDVQHADISDDSAVYEEFTVANLKLNSDVLEHYFDHDDDNHSYDVHLEE
ncbi:uncharacterized protein LOC109854203 isoform X2 [Pseudomyrmex gracilis]|uniref:uncharacterized protein LOC109854203 isoform X2 n=1 Tax=Pseudomyrmex gracilis TaxID=219809 RepID=UPI0009959381|nr:uncharacterized protein LOC109854203 isoform X2 [Pseudomyrmex gracilis]